MARIFVDGFEAGTYDLYLGESIIVGIIAARTGMSGSYCLGMNSSTPYIRRDLGASYTTIYHRARYEFVSFASDATGIVGFQDSAQTFIGGIFVNYTSKKMEYRATKAGAAIATGSAIMAPSTVYNIEVRWTPLNSGSGRVQVWLDGNIDIDYTGDSTAGLEEIRYFKMGRIEGSALAQAYYDDIVVDDANPIGNTRIAAIAPTGAGATTGWTASTGNNWDCVEEVPVSDANYVSVNTANAIDTYVMGNPTSSVGSIKSVTVQSRNWRTGNGAVGKLKHVVRPVSTDRVGATVNGGAYIPISATGFQTIWETNPEDAGAWEIADVEGMEAGVKAVTA